MLAMARRTTMRAAAHLRGLALPLVVATAYRRSFGTGAAGDVPFDDGRAHKDAGTLPLALVGELTYLPDSAKLQRGSQGEDAYMVSRYAVGVAGASRGFSGRGCTFAVRARVEQQAHAALSTRSQTLPDTHHHRASSSPPRLLLPRYRRRRWRMDRRRRRRGQV